MKYIENLGATVLENRWILYVLIALSGLVFLYNQPQRVILDEKHWECGNPVPDGIGSRCTTFYFRGK